MKWSEELYDQNAIKTRETASKLASLLVDEAETFLSAHPQPGLSVESITQERLEMLMEALLQRINQQLTVRGHVEDDLQIS